MPEAPELRHSADTLQPFFLRRIGSARTFSTGRYRSKPPRGHDQFIADCEEHPAYIEEINVKGKFMWWRVRTGKKPWWLWTTYGMTGGWRVFSGVHAADVKHLAYSLPLLPTPTDQSWLGFVDQRHFGTIRWVDDPEVHAKKLGSLGPDMLNDPVTRDEFAATLLKGKRGRKTLAELLMNQSVISGVGNYVKAEVLHRAALSPHRTADSLSSHEMSHLWLSTLVFLQEAYQRHGATIQSYADANGNTGTATDLFHVYGRYATPEGHPVVREETADGRATWWCPLTQK